MQAKRCNKLLLADCPRLFHMAEAGSWPSIRERGLLSTSALLDLHGVAGEAREAIEARRRPAAVALAPGVTVRDNGPLNEAADASVDPLSSAIWSWTS